MFSLVIVLHIIVSIALILIVLLQTGKGAEMGASFGGGSNQTVFGSRGAATFLSKVTTGAAVLFMLTSLSLAIMSKNRNASVVSDAAPVAAPTALPVPEAPVTLPVPDAPATLPAPEAAPIPAAPVVPAPDAQ